MERSKLLFWNRNLKPVQCICQSCYITHWLWRRTALCRWCWIFTWESKIKKLNSRRKYQTSTTARWKTSCDFVSCKRAATGAQGGARPACSNKCEVFIPELVKLELNPTASKTGSLFYVVETCPWRVLQPASLCLFPCETRSYLYLHDVLRFTVRKQPTGNALVHHGHHLGVYQLVWLAWCINAASLADTIQAKCCCWPHLYVSCSIYSVTILLIFHNNICQHPYVVVLVEHLVLL